MLLNIFEVNEFYRNLAKEIISISIYIIRYKFFNNFF